MPLKCVPTVFVIIVTSFAMMPFLPACKAGGCGCPPFWTAFHSHCYRYFSVKNITWHGAEMHCRSFSVPCTDADSNVTLGHLTSVHSREEMDFISVLYEDLRSKVVTDHVTRVWIGFHDLIAEESWEWSDGTEVDFTQWDEGQPNNIINQDCAEFHSTSLGYEWHDKPCEANLEYTYPVMGYICKLPQW